MSTERTPKEILEELNQVMDTVLKDMAIWEDRLMKMIETGDGDKVVDVAYQGGDYDHKVKVVKLELDRTRSKRTDDEAERKELDDLDAEVETKCEIVNEKIQETLEKIFDLKDELGESLDRVHQQIKDLDFYTDLDEE